ncbi:MAG: response regulator [Lachnospiraceae bacterium]|jgi:PAS domain S-box-containing protein|nr:response regulator [Lachnospiraceae bacterium]
MAKVNMKEIKAFAKDIPDGFLIVKADKQEDILYVNDAVLKIFACKTLEQFVDLTDYSFKGIVFSEDYERAKSFISEQAQKLKMKFGCVEYRIKRRDGEIRWVEDYGKLVSTEDYGDVYYVLMRDVTEKHELEEQLEIRRKMEIELEKELKRELEREKHLNEVKTNFLFNLSHDIRTPMNAIVGYTDLAKKHLKDGKGLKEYLEHVSESSNHLLSLIDALLEMSVIQNEEIVAKNEVCDIRKQLNIVIDMFRVAADDKKIKIVVNDELPDDNVYLDMALFRRGLGNIIDNAVKFTHDKGTITITAKRQQKSKSGYAKYCFTVQDTGVGIDSDFMGRMYDAFEREVTSTVAGYIGPGLGLTISKKMLGAMGGVITAESKKGEGATFTVEIPLEIAAKDKSVAKSKAPKEEVKAKGKYRVLLVEDVEINRLLAEQILLEAGFMVDAVADGSDSIEMVGGNPEGYYDAILMDIQMPVMNGYEATKRIRKLKRKDTKKIPIIALSANARNEDMKMSVECGMNTHISKPFNAEELVGTLNKYIK